MSVFVPNDVYVCLSVCEHPNLPDHGVCVLLFSAFATPDRYQPVYEWVCLRVCVCVCVFISA